MRAGQTPDWVDPGWLTTVPDRLDRCAGRWSLTIGERLGRGNTSRVFACVAADGRDLVVKLAPPEARPELEAAALRAWGGRGAVRLVDADPVAGALLLERLVPGTPLPPADDAAAIELVAPTLIALHAAPRDRASSFPTQLEFLDAWLSWVRRSAENGTAGLRLLDRAESAARGLCSDKTATVLLHGDFIDKNLLLHRGGCVAVDPLPRIGDPCSDVGFYSAYHPPARDIGRRARSLAVRCGLAQERAARWAAVWAVGEATETWRPDSDELQAWVESAEATQLLEH